MARKEGGYKGYLFGGKMGPSRRIMRETKSKIAIFGE
jgi:hypothetical protein